MLSDPTFARRVAGFVLGVVSLALGCWVIRTVVPVGSPVTQDLINFKFAQLDANPQPYDTFFIGSSRVHRQIEPRVFDAQAEALGRQTHSFNFGAPSMTEPELYDVVHRLIERGAADGATFLMDVTFDFQFAMWNSKSLRRVSFATPANAIRGLHWAWTRPADDVSRLTETHALMTSLTHHMLNVGVLERRAFQSTAQPDFVVDRSWRGYVPFEAERMDLSLRRNYYWDHLAEHDGGLRATLAMFKPAPRRMLTTAQRDFLLRLNDDLTRAGGRMVLLQPVGEELAWQVAAIEAAWRGELPFDALVLPPDHYADDLLRDDYWFDTRHLSAAGARVYSKLLAKDYVEQILSRRPERNTSPAP